MLEQLNKILDKGFLESRVEDNYGRLIVACYLTGIVGTLFVLLSMYNLNQGLGHKLTGWYMLTWLTLVFLSALFRFAFPLLHKHSTAVKLDWAMFFYATCVCFVAATISALDSNDKSDFTAYAFTILGTATVYRTSLYKYITMIGATAGFFAFVYFSVFANPISLGMLLPLLVLGALSVFIAASQELNRRDMDIMSQELSDMNQKLLEETIRDPLTKLYNRRYLTDFLEREIKEFQRSKEPFCVAVVDLDHFKKINDTLGHLVGDNALIQFAELLKKTSRSTDILIRFGGEEFVVVMPRTEIGAALMVSHRIKEAIENTEFNKIPWSLTASFGLTQVRVKDSENLLLARADDLLYQAKELGRNRIECDRMASQPELTEDNKASSHSA